MCKAIWQCCVPFQHYMHGLIDLWLGKVCSTQGHSGGFFKSFSSDTEFIPKSSEAMCVGLLRPDLDVLPVPGQWWSQVRSDAMQMLACPFGCFLHFPALSCSSCKPRVHQGTFPCWHHQHSALSVPTTFWQRWNEQMTSIKERFQFQ